VVGEKSMMGKRLAEDRDTWRKLTPTPKELATSYSLAVHNSHIIALSNHNFGNTGSWLDQGV